MIRTFAQLAHRGQFARSGAGGNGWRSGIDDRWRRGVVCETLPLAIASNSRRFTSRSTAMCIFPHGIAEWQEVSRVAHSADAQNALAMTFVEWRRRT
ncbi:hypothetical protein [Chromatium okenii]|uniref:hypothetical protein n=1 Tax=Chromatium okenii TaxID=61644 RepID=UPI00322158B0